METRRLLPPHRFSPADDNDYMYGPHNEVIPSTRRPLGESSGNVQAHTLAALALCQQNSLSISPPLHNIPTPPILPTQTLPSTYGTSLRGDRRSFQQDGSVRDSSVGINGHRNPFYESPHFLHYRQKVLTKEQDLEHPKWPEELESAFLDALLLIPQMARKKFSAHSILYGRNMLITEYLWIHHWLLHPMPNGEARPSTKDAERLNDGKPHPAFRGRKQVSSHIQVLKNFFMALPTFHFIFPSKKDINEDDRKYSKEETDIESFKNNKVLRAIANGQLPDQRPNYEYFGRLLQAGNDVFIRPKQCRIYVSSQMVEIRKREIPAEDGTKGKKQAQIQGYHRVSKARILDQTDYPHLDRNYNDDYVTPWSDATTTLLHSYTNELHLKEACAMQEISNRWSLRFPDLVDKLRSAMGDGKEADELSEKSSRCVLGPIDALHFEVILDLHGNSRFPDGSHCNGLVELELARPGLFRGHSWRTITTVDKPDALYYEDKNREVEDHKSEASLIPGHRPDCFWSTSYNERDKAGHAGHAGAKAPAQRGNVVPVVGYPHCNCSAQGVLDSIVVRFPAESWANTFVMLAPYVKAAHEELDRELEIERWIDDKGKTSQGGSGTGSQSRAVKGKNPRKRAASSESPSPPPPSKKARASSSASSVGSSASAAAQTSTTAPKGVKRRELIELLQEVAMYQEIYSAPPVEQQPGASVGEDVKPPQQKWTRRAVLVWTFAPALKTLGPKPNNKGNKDEADKPRPIKAAQPRTNWRYLTKLDPSSQYNQKNAYLTGPPAVIRAPSFATTTNNLSRNSVMSPDPAYMQHQHAAMNENFGAAAMYHHHHQQQQQQQSLISSTMAHPQHQFHDHVSMAGTSGAIMAPNLSLDVSGGYVDVMGSSGGYDGSNGVGGGLATPPPTATTLQGNGFSNNTNTYGFGRRGRGSIAGSSVSSSSADGASAVTTTSGLQHPHHHFHQQQQQQQHQQHHHQLASNGTDPFLSGLSVGPSSFNDVTATDTTAANECDTAGLQAWAAAHHHHEQQQSGGSGGLIGIQQNHGLLMDDSSPWEDTTPTTHWMEARDLATAATQHHQQQQQQQAQQWDSLSPSHVWTNGEDGNHNGNGNDENNGDSTANADVIESATLWSSPSPHEQQPQVPDHHATWAAWQAIEEEAAGSNEQQPWDEEGPTATTAAAAAEEEEGGSNVLLLGSTGLTPRPNSRKRSRADDGNNSNNGGDSGDDVASDGGMRYPVSSIRRRKLTHGGSSNGAPTAVMGDEFNL